MKTQVSNKYWIDETGGIGLTKEFLSQLGVIWAILYKDTDKLVVGVPFINIESSKMLGPLRAPVSGTIVSRNTDIVANPEAINEDTILLKVKL
jgi:glycine cleavage system H lipoate-binding protein